MTSYSNVLKEVSRLISMFSVFSDYLAPIYGANAFGLKPVEKPNKIYDQLRIAYNRGVTGIEYCTRLFVPNLVSGEELVDLIHSNIELTRIVRWVNRKILLCIGIQTYETIAVRLRIATCMLFKLVDSNKLKKDDATLLHLNLTHSVHLACYQVATEDLPF